jgi:glycosyltransferase involved in cell wall biosynthesis
MMEAQSYGIPIIARAVGGVPELVTSRTGTLVPADAPVPAIAEALNHVLDGNRFERSEIRAAFAARYEASTNYDAFADELLELWASRT